MANPINIQIGIDLGTTNSSVAINNNGSIEIIKKPGGVEYTPSVFGFDKAGNKVVGQKAYEAYYRYSSKDEEKNYKPEVKRLMGTSETFHFERADVEMNPEAISAEILKNLKEDILRKYPDFNTTGVVIMDGLPYFGSDVGGVLSLTPRVFIVGLMMYEKRLSLKTIIYALLITLATLTAFSLFDLSRPLSERTHLGRFVKVVLNGEGRTIIERKILSNLHILTNSLTATVVIIATIFLIFLFLKPEKFVKQMSLSNPGFRYIVYPGLVVGLLGMLLNDSGVAIPGMMLSIAAPTIALLSFENLSKVELDADLSDKTV